MASSHGSRSLVDVVAEDIASLSAALANAEHLPSTGKITMARRVGFAVGVDLGSKHPPAKLVDINSEIASLFHRLNLEDVALHEWDPLVFVIHSNPSKKRSSISKVNLEAAFGEGVLEGFVRGRKQGRIFVRHSIPFDKRHGYGGKTRVTGKTGSLKRYGP